MAKHFYTEMVPELEELADQGEQSGDARKRGCAKALRAKLEEVLNSDNHRWYLNKLIRKNWNSESSGRRNSRNATANNRLGYSLILRLSRKASCACVQ